MTKRPTNSKGRARSQAKKTRDREIKHKAAKLKKRGLIYQTKSLRNKTVTDYMRRRVRELEGVLEGRLTFVEVPKQVATKYKYRDAIKHVKKGKRRGVLVPVDTAGGKISLDKKRGLIRNIKELGDGHVLERIELPVDVTDVGEFIAWIDSGEPERLKYPNEYFGLRIYGHGSLSAIPNTETLSEYIKVRYKSVVMHDDVELNPADEDGPIALELFRVWPPEAWENLIAEEQIAYRASPEYQARQKRKREKRNLKSRIRYARKKRAKGNVDNRTLDLDRLVKEREEARKKKARDKKRKQREKKK